jgi:hypothetical protein
MQAIESALPLNEVKSFRELGGFGKDEPMPPKLISSSGLPDIALVAADTASFTVSD